MEKNNNNIPNNEEKSWQDFLKNPDQYSDQNQQKEGSSLHDYHISIDLHGLDCQAAYEKIIKAINYSHLNNIKLMHIITGIGHRNNHKGILYTDTPKWLDILKKQKKILKYYRNKNNDGEIIVEL